MFYSGKVARFMSLAKNVARQSDFPNYRHGAVLVRGGSIINTSPNKDSFCSFGARFRNNLPGHATVHAEIGAILGLDRSITDGAVLYVARIGKLDDFKHCEQEEIKNEDFEDLNYYYFKSTTID